jgi:hypothetical protein
MFTKDEVLEMVEFICLNELDRDEAFELVEKKFTHVQQLNRTSQ